MAVKKEFIKKLNKKVWGYDARVDGRRVQKFGFSTRQLAEEALAARRILAIERRAGVRPEEVPDVTVKELVERRKAQLGEARRRKVVKANLDRWLSTLPAGLLVTELTTSHIQNFADARLQGRKSQTVFRELTDICSMLNSARDSFPSLERWVPPRRPRLKAPNSARDRIITAGEAAAILGHLRRPRADGETERYHRVRLDSADLLQIALLTAARRDEILSLRWTDVNYEWGTLRVVGKKTEQVRVIPMADSLIALLRRRQAGCRESPLVFPALEGTTMLRYNTDQIYRAACKNLKILYGRDVPGGWVLHDARHTAITAMLHAGNSLESVMAISGHNARVMAMRYAHSTEKTRRAAVSALEQFAS